MSATPFPDRSGDPTRTGNTVTAGGPNERPHTARELLPEIFEELRKLAPARWCDETGTQTLQPLALVHEAWLRLTSADASRWQNRGHFFAAAAEAMRRILIDRARAKHAIKRSA